MTILGWKQLISLIILNSFSLWLTYGYFISSNPLTLSHIHMIPECQLYTDFPENLHYGQETTITGRLNCREHMPRDLMAQAILICGDLTTLTTNITNIKEDGTFILKIDTSFPRPSADEVQCSLTVQIISKTVSTELIEKRTLIMFVAG